MEKKFEKSGMQTCLGQSSDTVSGMETKWRAHCGGRKHRADYRLPGGRKAKHARGQRRSGAQTGLVHDSLGWLGKDSTVTKLPEGKGGGCWVLIKDNDRPYKVFSNHLDISPTLCDGQRERKAELFSCLLSSLSNRLNKSPLQESES